MAILTKGAKVRILKASSEYKGKIGKLVDETTTGDWWVSFDKGHVQEVFAIAEFEAFPGKSVASHRRGASNPPFAMWE